MRTIDAVLFDKTGTLTKGEHAVMGIATANDADEADVWRIAGGVEADSEHPLARAIVRSASEHGPIASATEFRSLTGRGVEATVDGAAYAVGGPTLLRERGLVEPAEISAVADGWRERGSAVLYLVDDRRVIGAFALEDEVRPEASYGSLASEW
jgi:Cu2+-exporting ATPase